MGQLSSSGNSNSWGAVDSFRNVQSTSTAGLESAMGGVASRTSVSGTGFANWATGGRAGNTVSPVAGIDQFFTAASGGTDVAGMNVENIPQIIDAVNQYVAAIDRQIANLENADAERRNAFRGEELQAAVAGFINSCREHLLDISSHLRSFNGRLRDVGETYRRNVATNATDVSAQAQTLQGATSRYVGE